MAARSVTQLYDSAFRRIDLRGTQFAVLAAISKVGPIPMNRLSERLVMDRTTLTRDLKPLERDGFVTVKAGEDKRVRLVELTESGRLKVNQGVPIWESLQDHVFEQMGKKNWNSLMKGLTQATRAVQRSSDLFLSL